MAVPTGTGQYRRRQSYRNVLNKRTLYVSSRDAPVDRAIEYNNNTMAAPHSICDADSYLQEDVNEDLNESSDIGNIFNVNNCDQTALKVMENNPEPSQENDLQDIDITCNQRAAANIDISPTPLIDYIVEETGLIVVKEDNITNENMATYIGSNPCLKNKGQKNVK